jgi:2',3'-cyclic-nucleotide 2'-phosphodiesterase (5'-nucleotidase family)
MSPAPRRSPPGLPRFLAATALAGLLAACAHAGPPEPGAAPPPAPTPAPAAAAADVVTLHIVHTNDVHGQLRPLRATWLRVPEPPLVGGAHALAGYVAQARARHGARMLLLDAGDIFQGTPEGNLTRGQSVVALFNHLGFDAVAVGNHDFDLGEDVLEAMVAASRFPWLSANLLRLPGREPVPYARPYVVKDVAGLKVAVVGLAPPDLHDLCVPHAVARVAVSPEEEAARRVVQQARDQGADVVVLLTHVGIERDKRLAERVEGVDAIIGGHSHTGIAKTWHAAATGTLVAQTWGKTTGVGHVELDFDRRAGRVVASRSELVDLRADDWPQDAAVTAVLEPYTADIDAQMAEVVGEAQEALTRTVGHETSALGNLLTDAIRATAGADVALQNKTGIRADLPAGPLTLRDAYQVCPFGNTIVVLRMSGQALLDALEYSLSDDYFALEVSGMQVHVDPRRPRGERVLAAAVGGAPLERERVYRVATSVFLAGGGDGHARLREAERDGEIHVTLREALMTRLRAERPVRPDSATRFIVAGN